MRTCILFAQRYQLRTFCRRTPRGRVADVSLNGSQRLRRPAERLTSVSSVSIDHAAASPAVSDFPRPLGCVCVGTAEIE